MGQWDKITIEIDEEMKYSEGVAHSGFGKVLLIVPALIAMILQNRPH